MAEKNYYLILGVSPGTSGDQIRSAFRRLAKKYHPDKTGGERTANFQEITEAYEVLSDPEKRGSYNRKLEEEKSLRKQRPAASFDREKGPERIRRERRRSDDGREGFFGDIFHDSFFTCDFFPERERSSRKVDVLELDAYLTPEEASRGARVEMKIPVARPCPECRGRGGLFAFDCPICEGSGKYETEKTVEIDFPPGIRPETLLRATVPSRKENCLQLLIHVHIIRSAMKT